jgi:peptidoglycan biosynthesis protein MviN/MurJ (putative lipid II flippase)
MRKVKGTMAEDLAFPSGQFFWSLSFAYASFMALLLQKAILPLWPEMHAGHGLLMNDAIIFHNMAVEIAQRIHSNGWSEWHIYPKGASANVGLLSLLYALLDTDPAWFIPFNAAAHATGALLIYRIGARLVDGDAGKLGGLLAAICFLVFPSALQWYGQNHKDAFAIVGLLLVLDAWMAIHDDQYSFRVQDSIRVFFSALLGVLLLGLVRSYFVVVVAIGLLASFLIASIWRCRAKAVAIRLVFVVVIALLAAVFMRFGIAEGVYGDSVGANTSIFEEFLWKENDGIPLVLEKTLRRASELRAHFVYFGRSVGAGSDIDGDQLPNTAWATLAYMPRALFVGLFAPFPETWGERVTLPRLVGAMETAVWYLAFLGVIVSVARYRSRKLLASVAFCAVLITMLAYIHPNVGTLYRQRYGLWHFFLLVGCIGWVSLLPERFGRLSVSVSPIAVIDRFPDQRATALTSSDRLLGQGPVVVLITLSCYLGFFARDLLLTGQLGLGGELDAFFAAVIIPMFFVSCLAMPFSDALVLPFVSSRKRGSGDDARLLRGTLSLALVLLFGATCFVSMSASWLVALVLSNATEEAQILAVTLVRWSAPIITLSAWTVVGNAALNALRKPRASALGQLVVPIVTLASLVLAPSGQIMAAGIGGMLLGTLMNVLFVFWQLSDSSLLLLPSNSLFVNTREVRRIYWPLVAGAILPAALIPVNYLFAASVSTGMGATWAFASKLVVLFSGLASVVVTAVVLPRTADLISSGEHVRSDVNLLITLGVWLGGVVMLAGFLFAEPLVAIFLGRGLSVAEVRDLALIAKIGLMQIPVVIIGVLANKFATLAGRSAWVMYSSVLAFSVNFGINLLLTPQIGVLGVAIGALWGGIISISVVLVGVHRQIGLSLREILIASACWLSWVAVCVGLVSNSGAALIAGIAMLGLMARLQWVVLVTPAPN